MGEGDRGEGQKLSVRNWCRCRAAGSYPCGVDVTAERCRFFRALAVDQVAVRSKAAEARTPQRGTQGTQRTRHLAAAILGASDQGRAGVRPPRRVLLDQSVETRFGDKGARLAAFVISSRREGRDRCRRLGGGL